MYQKESSPTSPPLHSSMLSRHPLTSPEMAKPPSPPAFQLERHHLQSLPLTTSEQCRSAVPAPTTEPCPRAAQPPQNFHVSTLHSFQLSPSTETLMPVSHVPAAVRVQRRMLQDDVISEASDFEAWTSAHLERCYVNPLTSEERVSLRFPDGSTADVVSGAVLFPHERVPDEQHA